MSGTLRASTGAYNNDVGLPSGGSVTIPVPGTTQVDDILLVLLQQTATALDVTSAPAGWSKLASRTGPTGGVIVGWAKRATAGDLGSSPTFTGTNATDLAGAMLVIDNVSSTASGGTGMIGNLTASGTGTSLTVPATGFGSNVGYSVFAAAQGSASGTKSLDSTVTGISAGPNQLIGIDLDRTSPTLARTFTTDVSTSKALFVLVFGTDVLPNAPDQLTPNGSVTFDRATAQRFSWRFTDADPGDTQAAYQIRYSVVGTGTWTTIGKTTPSQFRDFAASFFAAGDYEWQVRTADSHGAYGPWSASAFFTAADLPAAATITAPTAGGTVGGSAGLTWSFPAQTAYQWRRVADLAGVPDTATVYEDSGTVVNAGTRSVPLVFTTNNRHEHLQVRVQDADTGLWVDWSSVRVLVSYTPPPSPALLALATKTLDIPGEFTNAIEVQLALAPFNLLSTNQASVEIDLTGLVAISNCTVARSTAQAADGAASMAMTSTGSSDMSAGTPSGLSGFPVTPGVINVGTASVRSATIARGAFLRMEFYDATGAILSAVTRMEGERVTTTTIGWTQMTTAGIAPDTAAFARLVVVIVAPAGAGEVHYADKLGIFVDPTADILREGTFEAVTVGWSTTGTNTTIGVSTAQAFVGAQSMTLTSIAAGITQARTPTGNSHQHRVTPGRTYAFGGRFRAATAARLVKVRMQFYDAAGATVAPPVEGNEVLDSTTEWTLATVTATAPANAAFLTFLLFVRDTGAAGEVHYFDGAQAFQSSAFPTVYTARASFPWALPPSPLSHLDLYRRETAAGGDGMRIAKDLPGGSTYTDHTAASGVEYEYQAVATGTNDTTAVGEWTG